MRILGLTEFLSEELILLLLGRYPVKKRGRAFRSYLFARDLSKRITAAIANAAPRWVLAFGF